MDRKLASVRLIKSVQSIPEADNIEQVVVDGWTCVSKKGEFQSGDRCVYFEIDSFLPVKPVFEFLRRTSYQKMADRDGFRLKTIRMRGVLSQGLALPITILENHRNYSVGADVTEILGVGKFELPIPAELQGVAKGFFPTFVAKTDQERVQNIWDEIKNNISSFEVTLKLDGSSCTYYYHNGEFGVCSRNFELERSERNTLWKIAKQYDIEELLRSFGKNIALQGEIIGEGVQKNPEKIRGQDFYLFDIWCINERRYYLPPERIRWYESHFSSLKHVPVLEKECFLERFATLEEILSFAEGSSLNNPIREGIVLRANTSGLTFKVISNQYLLNESE